MPHHGDNACAFSELLLIRGGYSSAVAALRYRPLNSQQAACTTVELHIPGNRPAKLLCLRRLQIFWTFAKKQSSSPVRLGIDRGRTDLIQTGSHKDDFVKRLAGPVDSTNYACTHARMQRALGLSYCQRVWHII